MPRSPALNALVLLVAGILLGHHKGIENVSLIRFLTAVVLVPTGLFCFRFFYLPNARSILIYLCTFFCGLLLCVSDHIHSDSSSFKDSDEIRLYVLKALSFTTGLEADAYFDAEIFGDKEGTKLGARVYLPIGGDKNDLEIGLGALLTCAGTVQNFSPVRNPGQTDFARIFENKGIQMTMHAKSCTVEERSPWKIIRTAYGFRKFIKSTIAQSSLSAEAKGISLALSIGDKSALSSSDRDSFRSSGLMHLLAISGLHVGFLALGIFHLLSGLFRRFSIPPRIILHVRVSIVLLILANYIFLTGMTDSVLRSSLMCVVYVLSLLSGRPFSSLNALALAAILILILRPHHLLDLGFQLSFSAVFGIIILYTPLSGMIDSKKKIKMASIAKILTLSGIAYLATSPILLYHFSFAPLVGIVSSVLATPLCFLSLTSLWIWLALKALFLDFAFSEQALALFLDAFSQSSKFWASDWFIGLGIKIDQTEKGWILILPILSGLLYFHQRKMKSQKWISVFMMPAFLFFLSVQSQSDPDYDIIFFDVGHGDAILVSSPTGKNILIDAGDKSDYGVYSRDLGRTVLLPAFQYLGIDQIDVAFLTHRHRDHFGGFESLVNSIPIHSFLSNDDGAFVSESWEQLKKHLTLSQTKLYQVNRGDRISLGGINVSVLNPSSNDRSGDENNQSLQLLIEIGKVQILLLGDSELEAEWDLLDRNLNLEADIVKVGHHGSKTSSSVELIQGLRSHKKNQMAIISASATFRPPSKNKINDWKSSGFKTICTCDQGAIWIKTDGKHFYTSS